MCRRFCAARRTRAYFLAFSRSLGIRMRPSMSDAAIAAEPEKPRSWLSRFASLELLDNRYPSLHGLRVMGIISVVQWHVTWILWFENDVPLNRPLVDFFTSIFFGMDLFFVL